MKLTNKLLTLAAISSSLFCGRVMADVGTNAPPPNASPPAAPVVVATKPDLSKLPADVQVLLKSFQKTREDYLATQKALVDQLSGATAAQKDAIRDQLQANRQAFLDQLQTFRTEIKKEVQERHNEILDRWLKNHDGLPNSGTNHHKGSGR